MEPEQPPSTPSTHPSDPLHSLQPASTDRRPFQGTQSDERLRDRPAPSQGTSMWPRTFQGNYLPDTSLQSSMHHVLRGNTLSGNQATPTLYAGILAWTPHRLMCTPIPVIYPAFRIQTHLMSCSTLTLRRNNFGVATPSRPQALWSIHMMGNRRRYTHLRLPASLSSTGSRVLLCLKTV